MRNMSIYSIITLLLCSCQEKAKPEPVHVDVIRIDYKSEIYKLAIGQSYKISDRFIDWSWAGENDPDGRIDSSGIDAFLYLQEPKLHYKGQACLPSLHIYTIQNLITAFSCSVLIFPEPDASAIDSFIYMMQKDIHMLNDQIVIAALKQNGRYEKRDLHYTETIEIKGYDQKGFDRFEYLVKYIP